MSLFDRWCFEWGRVGRVHARRTALGLSWDSERLYARDMMIWGESKTALVIDWPLLTRLQQAGLLLEPWEDS